MLNIRSEITKRILNYFFLNEKKKIYINELARIVDKDPKNVYRSLIQLSDMGLLESEFSGKQRYFYSNANNIFYKQYRNIFLKTAGIEGLLREKLKMLSGLKEAYIFGSYAKGKVKPGSDIDLLLVGEHNRTEAERIIFSMQKHLSREINIVNLKPTEFKKRKDEKEQFIAEIFKQKVIRLI